MDSLDCSSFEADEFLPSLDADESSSGALPTSEEAAAVTSSDAAVTCSDAAADTTSGDVALVTSDDATDPATAPSGKCRIRTATPAVTFSCPMYLSCICC